MPHLFVDISSHGFGHLAQTAPVLEALAATLPKLQLTIRSGLSTEQLRLRISHPFTAITEASDVAFLMHDAVRVDREASAAAYRAAHADWGGKVDAEAKLLAQLAPDLVLSNISCLPLAGAKQAGIPSVAMCSLNWADQFLFMFPGEPWAKLIHEQLLAAYAGADAFLACQPAMPMPDLPNIVVVPPIARQGFPQREVLEQRLNLQGKRLVLVAMGGIGFDLPTAHWPQTPDIHWLTKEKPWQGRTDITAYPALGMHFSDLLASVDAVLTKPGYGMFVESAATGAPLLYLRREDWPEQEALIDWLQTNAVCAEVSADDFAAGSFVPQLQALWRQPRTKTVANGAAAVAEYLSGLLTANNRNA